MNLYPKTVLIPDIDLPSIRKCRSPKILDATGANIPNNFCNTTPKNSKITIVPPFLENSIIFYGEYALNMLLYGSSKQCDFIDVVCTNKTMVYAYMDYLVDNVSKAISVNKNFILFELIKDKQYIRFYYKMLYAKEFDKIFSVYENEPFYKIAYYNDAFYCHQDFLDMNWVIKVDSQKQIIYNDHYEYEVRKCLEKGFTVQFAEEFDKENMDYIKNELPSADFLYGYRLILAPKFSKQDYMKELTKFFKSINEKTLKQNIILSCIYTKYHNYFSNTRYLFMNLISDSKIRHAFFQNFDIEHDLYKYTNVHICSKIDRDNLYYVIYNDHNITTVEYFNEDRDELGTPDSYCILDDAIRQYEYNNNSNLLEIIFFEFN